MKNTMKDHMLLKRKNQLEIKILNISFQNRIKLNFIFKNRLKVQVLRLFF